MPRFYYAYELFDDGSRAYLIYDRLRGDRYMATCSDAVDAERIVTALNEPRKKFKFPWERC